MHIRPLKLFLTNAIMLELQFIWQAFIALCCQQIKRMIVLRNRKGFRCGAGDTASKPGSDTGDV